MPYESPDISVTRVELESSICSGSVDITAQAPAVSNNDQVINTDFADQNNFSSGTTWDNSNN